MNKVLLFFFLLYTGSLVAQPAFAYIDSIRVEGNRKTKTKTILRELPIRVGDTIAIEDLTRLLERCESQVINTGLFTKAKVTLKNWIAKGNKVHILIEVIESWYIYPVPLFELADRNFNVWWVQQNRSLKRVNYGIEFAHQNFSGKRDRLKIGVKNGYTRKYSIKYSLPFINQKQTIGLLSDFSYSQNRELNYNTVSNLQEFYRDDEQFVFYRFKLEGGITYRPGLHLQHSLVTNFFQHKIQDTIAQVLNPDYFLEGRNLQRFFALRYEFQYDFRDFIAYAMKGSYAYIRLKKNGLGIFNDINGLTISARYDQYITLSKRWSTVFSTKGQYSLIRQRQPYNENRALGFGDSNIRGYDFLYHRWTRYGLFKE